MNIAFTLGLIIPANVRKVFVYIYFILIAIAVIAIKKPKTTGNIIVSRFGSDFEISVFKRLLARDNPCGVFITEKVTLPCF